MAHINEYGEIIRNDELSEIRNEIKNNFKDNMDRDFAEDLLSILNKEEYSIDLVKYLISQTEKYSNCITEDFAKYLIEKLEKLIPQKEDSIPSFVPPVKVDEKAALDAAKEKEEAKEKNKLSKDLLK